MLMVLLCLCLPVPRCPFIFAQLLTSLSASFASCILIYFPSLPPSPVPACLLLSPCLSPCQYCRYCTVMLPSIFVTPFPTAPSLASLHPSLLCVSPCLAFLPSFPSSSCPIPTFLLAPSSLYALFFMTCSDFPPFSVVFGSSFYPPLLFLHFCFVLPPPRPFARYLFLSLPPFLLVCLPFLPFCLLAHCFLIPVSLPRFHSLAGS